MTYERQGSTTNESEETDAGVTDAIQQAASSAVDSVQGIASSVADTTQDAVSGVVDKVQDVTGAVAEQANRVTDAAATQVESLADTVYQQAATPGAPALQRNVAETTVNVLDRTAEYLREGDLRLILEDLRSAIRRNPGRSVLLGLAAGYLARSTFFASSSTQSSQTTRRSQPYTPSFQPVPVSSGDFGMGLDTAYTASTMSGSTLSSDMAAGTDLGALTASSGMTTSDAAYLGETDTSLEADGDLLGTGSISSGLSGASTFGSDMATGGSLTGSDFGTLSAPSDTGSVMQDDLAGGSMLDSDDVFVASTDVTDQDLADDVQQLGAEDFRSDSTSTDTMPSDDVLARWDAETRGNTGEAS